MALTNAMELDELTENQADKFETHNDDLRRIQEAIGGTLALAMSDANYSLSTTTGSEEWRYKRIRVTGTLTANRDIVYPDKKGPHLFILENATTGGYTLTIKRSGQTGVAVKNGDTAILYHNGTDVIDALETSASIEKLVNFTSGVEIINMGAGNYTVPESQAGALFYVVGVATDGAVLSFDGSHPYPLDIRLLNLASGTTITAKLTGDIGGGVDVPYFEFRSLTPYQSNPQLFDPLIAYRAANGERLTVDFSSDANYTLGDYSHYYQYFEFTDTGTALTSGRDVIFSASKNIPRFIFKNSTAQTITVKVSGQTGVAVATGVTKDLYWTGTDIADAGAL